MPPDKDIYAFFVRAGQSAVAGVIDTSGAEKWQNNIRKSIGMADAEVHLVHEGEWEAPKLRSVDQGATPCIKGIQKYFAAHELAQLSRADFERQHLGDMKLDMTGLLVVLVRHSPATVPRTASQDVKPWWPRWTLQNRPYVDGAKPAIGAGAQAGVL